MSSSTPQLPSEFYKPSTLFTLGGSAGAVWLLCLVLGSFDPSNTLFTPTVFRIVALVFSLFISVLMFYRKKPEVVKVENYVLILLNGMLIFANASGFNAMSSKITFVNPDTLKSASTDDQAGVFGALALSLFGNEVFWWESEAKFIYYRDLKHTNNSLTTSLQECKQALVSQPEPDSTVDQSLIDDLNKRNEGLQASNERCREQLGTLRASMDSLNGKNRELMIQLKRCQQLLATQGNGGPLFNELTEILTQFPGSKVENNTRWIHMKAQRLAPGKLINKVTLNNTVLRIKEIRMTGNAMQDVYIQVTLPNGGLAEGVHTFAVEADNKTYKTSIQVIN